MLVHYYINCQIPILMACKAGSLLEKHVIPVFAIESQENAGWLHQKLLRSNIGTRTMFI